MACQPWQRPGRLPGAASHGRQSRTAGAASGSRARRTAAWWRCSRTSWVCWVSTCGGITAACLHCCTAPGVCCTKGHTLKMHHLLFYSIGSRVSHRALHPAHHHLPGAASGECAAWQLHMCLSATQSAPVFAVLHVQNLHCSNACAAASRPVRDRRQGVPAGAAAAGQNAEQDQ